MSKVSYKAIVKSLVNSKVRDFIEKHDGCRYVEQRIELSQDGDFQYPTFDSYFKQDFQEYRAHGYINEYGTVHICLIEYTSISYPTLEDAINDTNKNVKHNWIDYNQFKEFKFK